MQTIACEYALMGCKHKLMKTDILKHNKQSMAAHMNFMRLYIMKMHERLAYFEEKEAKENEVPVVSYSPFKEPTMEEINTKFNFVLETGVNLVLSEKGTRIKAGPS